MKILQYCQYILGIGHLCRSLEISRGFAGHDVVLVTGGRDFPVALPERVREHRLPALVMDAEFSGLKTPDQKRSLEAIKLLRRARLTEIFQAEKPDALLVELYPFGRKAFRFELDPLLEGIRNGSLHRCLVFCSLRDILVEKDNSRKHEHRAVDILNRLFDGLLVHADPDLIPLDRTFSLATDIAIPLDYTGFVCPGPSAPAGLRARLGISPREKWIVASAGGGQVGGPLLTAVMEAARKLAADIPVRLQVFTGPFLNQLEYQLLSSGRNHHIRVQRFTDRFPAYLAEADLSISMAGYNTCMNILAAGIPALVWPFPQNREQRLRAEALADRGLLGVLSETDLSADGMANRIRQALNQGRPPATTLRINGAEETRRVVEERIRKREAIA
ncbi:MAG: glycosyltransferase family protein [Thermodesulfobacteriota bacterium]